MAEAIRAGQTEGLEARLEEIGFASSDSVLIALAVRVTRPDLKAPAQPLETADREPVRWEQSVLDAGGVILLFNAVNRIAAAYGLDPEWSGWRRGERVRRLTRPLLSLGTRLLLSLRDAEPIPGPPMKGDLRPLLHAVGYTASPSDLGVLACPRLASAVFRMLSATIDHSQLGTTTEQLIARACWQKSPRPPDEVDLSDRLSSPPPSWETPGAGKAIFDFAEKLFARPYTVSPQDLNEVRQQGLDEGQILDLVFRVSVLAGIEKSNAEPIRNLISAPVG